MNELSTKLYRVNVPLITTYTEEEKEVFGFHMEHNNITNRMNANNGLFAMCSVMINIERMVEVFTGGNNISVPSEADAMEIYEEIQRYLLHSKHDYTRQLNVENSTDDVMLRELDNFAKEIFENNKTTITRGLTSNNTGYGLGLGLRTNTYAVANDTTDLDLDDEPINRFSGVDTSPTPNIINKPIKRRSLYEEI